MLPFTMLTASRSRSRAHSSPPPATTRRRATLPIPTSRSKPVCVDAPKGGGDDDFGNIGTDNPVERIQMAGEASQQELPVGERVKVKGTLFGAHTMWHVEEVLIDASSVDRQ
jgi:hypothetical protein